MMKSLAVFLITYIWAASLSAQTELDPQVSNHL